MASFLDKDFVIIASKMNVDALSYAYKSQSVINIFYNEFDYTKYYTTMWKSVDIRIDFAYIICSGCAVESRDAHSPGVLMREPPFFTTNKSRN